MIKHIVMWKFHPGTEDVQKQFLEGLQSLQGVIPELVASEVGVNVGADNYDAVLVSAFKNMDDLNTYKADPRHQAVVSQCKSAIASRVAVDYEC